MIKHALEQIGIEFSSENDREIQFKCVFHDDNTPSASINKKTGRWICFTCEVGGNILHLSNKQNVQLDNLNEIRAILRKNKLKSLLRKEPEQLNYYFFPKVFKKITNITDCPEYLLNRLSINTVLNFNLHYCDDKNSKYFERIIIPITLENNLGFTAREYTKNTNYKYLFPEGMQKSKFIFGDLNHQELIIVEGTFDVMKLWQHGYKNTISILGASINKTQIEYLLDHKVRKLIIFSDGDDAGRKLASSFEKYAHLFKIDIVSCKQDQDPSDMTLEEIKIAFNKKLSLNEILAKIQHDRKQKRLERSLYKSTANLFPN